MPVYNISVTIICWAAGVAEARYDTDEGDLARGLKMTFQS